MHKIPLEMRLAHRELVAKWQFTHPSDHYLVMVLCRNGLKPERFDTREWVTWYYNVDSGGFGEGHYFEANEEAKARADFRERCLRSAMPYSREESDRHLREGICITTMYSDKERTRMVFVCNNEVSAENRAAGCGICQTCEDEHMAAEGRCDGLAARRADHQRDE